MNRIFSINSFVIKLAFVCALQWWRRKQQNTRYVMLHSSETLSEFTAA